MLIPYDSITRIKDFSGPDALTVITHREGEFVLKFDMLPDERAYAEIVGNLKIKVQETQAGPRPSAVEGPQPD
jgi:hypothetical protein